MKQKQLWFSMILNVLRNNNLIIIMCYFLGSVNLFGQTDTNNVVENKASFGMIMGTSVSVVLEKLDYNPHLTIDKGKVFFAVGPVIGRNRRLKRNWSESYQSIPDKKYSIHGLNIVCQVNPNPKGKTFDFYFQILFVFLNYKSDGIAPAGSSAYPYGHFYSDQPFQANQRLVSGVVGYGFKLKFLRMFYLTQSVNFGICQNYVTIDYEGSANYKSKRLSPDMVFNLGLGFNLRNDRK